MFWFSEASSPCNLIMIPAILATILFCLSAVTANRATRLIGSVEANFWRLVLSVACLAIWAHGFGQGLRGTAFGVFFLSGVIGFGIGDVALYLAYPRLGSRLTLLLVHCLAAPVAAVGEWLILGTVLTGPEMLAGGCILLGVGIALAPGENPHISSRDLVVGGFFGVLGAAGQGLGAVLSRVGYGMNATDGIVVDGMSVAYQRILGGLLIGFVSYSWVRARTIPKRSKGPDGLSGAWAWIGMPSGNVWRWIVGTAMAGPVIGVTCFQWALEGAKSGVVLPIVATAPLVVMPLSLWMEGDRPGIRAVLGGVLAVIGVIGLSVVL